jgi:hypothetical protein
MKKTSIILSAGLLLPIFFCLLTVFQIHYTMDSPLVPEDIAVTAARPYIICCIAFVIFLIFSMALNLKGKYLGNIIISVCLILVYLIAVNFIGFQWLK